MVMSCEQDGGRVSPSSSSLGVGPRILPMAGVLGQGSRGNGRPAWPDGAGKGGVESQRGCGEAAFDAPTHGPYLRGVLRPDHCAARVAPRGLQMCLSSRVRDGGGAGCSRATRQSRRR